MTTRAEGTEAVQALARTLNSFDEVEFDVTGPEFTETYRGALLRLGGNIIVGATVLFHAEDGPNPAVTALELIEARD